MSKRRGYGSLFLRKGIWYFRLRHNGIEHTRSSRIANTGAASRAKAEKMLEEETIALRIESKIARLEVVKAMILSADKELKDTISDIRRNMTVGELDVSFRKSAFRIDCSNAQIETYCRYIGMLKDVFGERFKITDIDARLAGQFARRLAHKRSPNTFNKYLNGLGVVWRAVMPIAGLSSNPWEMIPRRKLDTNIRRVLSKEEVEKVLDTAKGEVKTLFAIGLYTGLRLGDAVKLSWSDIHDGNIFVTTSKTGAKVAIPLHPRLAEALGKRRDDSEKITPHLFKVYSYGKASLISQRFRKLFCRCGIETGKKVEMGKNVPIADSILCDTLLSADARKPAFRKI